MVDLGDWRQSYSNGHLDEDAMSKDPFIQFTQWFDEAKSSGTKEPNAFALATVSSEGQPTLRTVLLKYFDHSGFVFFTNYESKKAKQILTNPKVSMLFFWDTLERQVIITGKAEKISAAASLKYFLSRPRGSRLGAWVSNQSQIISSRNMLEMKLEEMKRKFRNKEVPLPDHWGGFKIVPDSLEFWLGRPNRLHDRFMYLKNKQNEWSINRLAP